MGILIGLLQQIRTWEASAKMALVVDLVLLIIALFIMSTNEALRTPALIGAAGLFIALQIIVLWGNRNMVAPYTQAQRHFMAGEFEKVRDVLQADMDDLQTKGKKPTIDSLVLLGNTYRNLGQLRESESVLRIAVARFPKYQFAHYGLAKTRQAIGVYDEALHHFGLALEYGAPEIVRFDYVFTMYLLGDDEVARPLLDTIPPTDEIHRTLMMTYLKHELINHPAPAKNLIEAGLPFWEAEIERYKNTRYTDDLRQILQKLNEVV